MAILRTIAEKLQQQGHACDKRKCREKIKALKKKYKEVADHLRLNSVGLKASKKSLQ